MRLIKGIDVSENNGSVDWSAVKNAGIKFVIVRSSYGKNSLDEDFLRNVEGAHSVGLKVGAYHYGYGLDPEDAIEEAENCRRVIEQAGVLLELPVFYDLEDADHYKARNGFDFSMSNCTAMCREFINHVQLNCGVYASYSWLENLIDWRSLGCPVWNAQWDDEDSLKGYLWQYTDSLEIEGHYFDGNILYEQ